MGMIFDKALGMTLKRILFSVLLVLHLSFFAQEIPTSFEYHKVKSGETLFGISQDYKISQETLLEYNPILSKTGLRKRMKLRIPIYDSPKLVEEKPIVKPLQTKDTLTTQLHVVQAKETKWRLAYQYGTTIADLEALNPEIKDGLKIGQTLQVPLPQVPKTVPEKDSLFNYYMVLPKEGYYRIEKKLGVTKRILDSLNPEVAENGLQEGMVLKIPGDFSGDLKVADDLLLERINLVDSVLYTKPLEIALMLPFRAKELNLDSLHLVRPVLESRNLYTIAFDFYMGAKMAAEKMTTLGIPITVNVIDTENNKNKIKEAVNASDWSTTDVIIGPIIPANFDYLTSFSTLENIPKIAPLSTNPVRKQKAIFQTQTQKETYRNKMLSYLEKVLDSTQNIVVVADSLNRPMERILTQKFPTAIKLRPEKEGYILPELVDSLLVDSLPNKVIFETTSFPLIASVLSQMNAQNTSERSVQVFTTYRDNLYDKAAIGLKILGGIKFTYPSNTLVRSTDQYSEFEWSYLEKFGKPPSKEAIRAYDVTLDALLRMAYSGSLSNSASLGETFYVQNSFSYTQDQNNSFVNEAVLILQHQGYEVKELKEW
jgi:LysM repeat protein